MHAHDTDTPGAYARHLQATRRAKDEYFAHSAHSPIPAAARPSFAGLAYYPPDRSYRFAGLRLEPVVDPGAAFTMDTSDGQARTAYRLGRLRFVLAGRELALTAYRVGAAADGSLFIPFRDGTSGRETYGAGRYLDLVPEADGTYVLDFNEAYHPYCAYADAYSCPLPPAENLLPIRIEAGERLGPVHGS